MDGAEFLLTVHDIAIAWLVFFAIVWLVSFVYLYLKIQLIKGIRDCLTERFGWTAIEERYDILWALERLSRFFISCLLFKPRWIRISSTQKEEET